MKDYLIQNIIICVVGHIDHGKTALIKALNGFDGDSTAQEQQAGNTFDLSFSNLFFSDMQKNIAFIDVPGHYNLVKNMIAGVFACDFVLLVVDCIEGVKPQTLEHLQIASFLNIKNVILVLSKRDKSSVEQRKKVFNNVVEVLEKFALVLVQKVETSIHEQESINVLKNVLSTLQVKAYKKSIFRYYIDRSFEIVGAGCVVSGTVLDGEVQEKEKLFCFDIAKTVEVKAINIHNKKVSCALPFTRAALNIVGVHKGELRRGYLLSKKGYLRGFKMIDVALFVYDDMPKPQHNSKISFYIGTKKTEVKLFFIRSFESCAKGLSCAFATLESNENIFAIFYERFILRDSCGVLVGGIVLNPIADPMNKAQKNKLLTYLYSKDYKSAFSVLVNAHKKGFGIISSFQRFHLTHKEILSYLREIKGVLVDEKELIVYPEEQIENLKNVVLNIIAKNPNALISAHSLCCKHSWATPMLFEYVLKKLENEKKLVLKDGLYICAHTHIENISSFIQKTIYNILEQCKYTPPAPYNIYDSLDIDRNSGDLAMKALCKSRKVIRLNNKLFIVSQFLHEILELLRDIIRKEGYVDVNNARMSLNISRKYLVAYLEYLDNFADIVNIEQKRFLKVYS